MKFRRIGLEANVFKFEFDKGFEDGYELYSFAAKRNRIDC